MGKELNLMRERKAKIITGDAARTAAQRNAGKLTARERIAKLLDESSFVETDQLAAIGESGVVTGYGMIEDRPVYVWAQDYTIKSGAVGVQQARKVVKLLELACKAGHPVVCMLDGAGARLDEGALAMDGYAQILSKMSELSGVVPQIALVLGPCAGSAVMFAELADVTIQAKVGQIMTHGPQVVSAVTGKTVDANALGGIEASQQSGLAQLTAETEDEALALARKLSQMLPDNSASEPPIIAHGDDWNRELLDLNEMESLADAHDAIIRMADGQDVVELMPGFAKDVVTAIGMMGDRSVAFIATQPGFLSPEGCRKLARFVRTADCFNLPIVSIIDSNGMAIEACNAGMARAQSQLMYSLCEANVPKVAVITGNAIGAAYITLASRAVADVIYAWPNAVISSLETPAAVQVFYKDELKAASDPQAKRAELEAKYQSEVADGINAASAGMVDDVIEPAATRQMVIGALETLQDKRDVKAPRKHGNMPL